MVEVTDAMVEAACDAHWWGAWPGDRDPRILEARRRDMRSALEAGLKDGPHQDLTKQLIEALQAAQEVVAVAAEMTSSRSDDEFVWNAQFKVEAALATARIRQGIQEAKANG